MKIVHTDEKVKLTLVISVCFIVFICAFFIIHKMAIRSVDISELPTINSEDAYSIYFDNADYCSKEDKVRISVDGWFFIKGNDSQNVSMNILIKTPDRDEAYVIPTTVLYRPDVTEFFNDGHCYDYSGFSAKSCFFKSNEPLDSYEILLHYENGEEYLIHTGRYLSLVE